MLKWCIHPCGHIFPNILIENKNLKKEVVSYLLFNDLQISWFCRHLINRKREHGIPRQVHSYLLFFHSPGSYLACACSILYVEHGLIFFLHLVTLLHEFLIINVNLHEVVLAFLFTVCLDLFFRFPCRRGTGLAWSVLATGPSFWGGSGS